jgi:chromosome segregation ATPase
MGKHHDKESKLKEALLKLEEVQSHYETQLNQLKEQLSHTSSSLDLTTVTLQQEKEAMESNYKAQLERLARSLDEMEQKNSSLEEIIMEQR